MAFAAAMFCVCAAVAGDPGFFPEGEAVSAADLRNELAYRVAFLVDCLVWVAVLVVWVFAAGWFARALRVPLGLWPGVPEYWEALGRYCDRCGIVVEGVSHHDPDPLGPRPLGLHACTDTSVADPKMLFYAGWWLYMFFVGCLFQDVPLGTGQKILLAAVTLLATLPNGVSYYLCCSYVWLLKDVAHGNVPSRLPRLLRCPSETPGYARLVAVARFNASFFLAVALLCSAGTSLTSLLLRGRPTFPALSLTVLVAAIGLATFLVLAVMSRAFLREVAAKRELESVEALEGELGGIYVAPPAVAGGNAPVAVSAGEWRGVDEAVRRQSGALAASELASFALGVTSLVIDVLSLLTTLGLLAP